MLICVLSALYSLYRILETHGLVCGFQYLQYLHIITPPMVSRRRRSITGGVILSRAAPYFENQCALKIIYLILISNKKV